MNELSGHFSRKRTVEGSGASTTSTERYWPFRLDPTPAGREDDLVVGRLDVRRRHRGPVVELDALAELERVDRGRPWRWSSSRPGRRRAWSRWDRSDRRGGACCRTAPAGGSARTSPRGGRRRRAARTAPGRRALRPSRGCCAPAGIPVISTATTSRATGASRRASSIASSSWSTSSHWGVHAVPAGAPPTAPGTAPGASVEARPFAICPVRPCHGHRYGHCRGEISLAGSGEPVKVDHWTSAQLSRGPAWQPGVCLDRES